MTCSRRTVGGLAGHRRDPLPISHYRKNSDKYYRKALLECCAYHHLLP